MASGHPKISKAHLATGRAVDQLRRQLGIVFKEHNGTQLGACPVEGLDTSLLATLPKRGRLLLLSAPRACHLGLATTRANAVAVHADRLTLRHIQMLADPLAPQTKLPKLSLVKIDKSHETLMTMVKYAALLPAILVVKGKMFPSDWLTVSASDVAAYWKNPPLDMVELAEAKLPVEGAENARIACFRSRFGTSTHLAMIFGDISHAGSPLVRVHSSCITGDILGSLRCDCGDQLRLAIDAMKKEGSGILVYLHQEGRGIGIANKLRAYALQEQGIDTYDANLALGFAEDERDFAMAAAILKELGIKKCRLLTNNPNKLKNLENHGVKVLSRVKIAVPAGRHNHDYLTTKALKSGHLF